MDYTILTNQFGPHPKLLQQTLRHANSAFNKPITPRNLFAWDRIHARIKKKPMPVILDSGCGKGLSSRILARKYPEHWIIAMDQSAVRLHFFRRQNLEHNILILQGNCIDFWRLIALSKLPIAKHYILYPNPWPKRQHLTRRWHAHPVARDMFLLASKTIIRSNWRVYVEEAKSVAQWLGHTTQLRTCQKHDAPLTHFEKKYQDQSMTCYTLSILP